MQESYSWKPIGFMRSPLRRREDAPEQGLRRCSGRLGRSGRRRWRRAAPAWPPDRKSVLVTWFHEASRDVLKVRARDEQEPPAHWRPDAVSRIGAAYSSWSQFQGLGGRWEAAQSRTAGSHRRNTSHRYQAGPFRSRRLLMRSQARPSQLMPMPPKYESRRFAFPPSDR